VVANPGLGKLEETLKSNGRESEEPSLKVNDA